MALEWLKKLFGGGKKEEAEMQAPQGGEQLSSDMGGDMGGNMSDQGMGDQEEMQDSGEEKQM